MTLQSGHWDDRLRERGDRYAGYADTECKGGRRQQSDVVLGAVQAVLSVGGLAGGALAGRSRHPLSDRQALGLLLGIAGLCAAMGVVLWVPPLACGGVALCGFGVMAAAMRFNVWFFARLQTVLPQAQLGRVTGCTMALASLTQPVGQAGYGDPI